MSKKCLDLFCGAGGLSKGFLDAGYEVIAGIDNNDEALITFKKNHLKSKAIKHDLSKNLIESNDQEIKNLLNQKIDILIGGPPCQGMSIAGKRIAEDPRNKLYKAYIKIIEHFKPEAIVLENVPTIMSLFNGDIADAIVNDFTEHGYTISVNTVYASDYGIPQRRRRTFFIGLRNKEFKFPQPFTQEIPLTCEDAISDLPLLNDDLGNEIMSYQVKEKNEYQRLMCEI